jgi:DNA ligase-1
MAYYHSIRIYKRGSTGAVYTWKFEVDGDKWRSIAGVMDGKPADQKWTVCTPKSQPTAHAQALFEAKAEEAKKLAREYRATIAELVNVPISPMLAQDFKKLKEPLTFPVYCQPKLDGIRALISRHGAFSREYQRHMNVEHILQALEPVFVKHPDLVLDGELYNHDYKDDFNAITSVVRKQNPTAAQRAAAMTLLQYHVYDIASDPYSFGSRRFMVGDLLGERLGPVHRVVTHKVTDQDGLDEAYAEYLKLGYEGQMIRLDAPYEPDKRSWSLMKRKEFEAAEFDLLRIEEGIGGWAGHAKKITFALPDGREVGAGVKGNQAFTKDLLANAARYLGGKVTVKFFKPTPAGVPRFPVAVDFHPNGRTD